MEVPNVKHDCIYHAEIKYETKEGFNFAGSAGDSIPELISDIRSRFKRYSNREPVIVEILKFKDDKKIKLENWSENEKKIFNEGISFHFGNLEDISDV